ncbi:MAG TPA: dihydrofolate reductase family protein [Ktedonobacteraceae bacterium]|nr:dihydrofolate reductase family protein [Ktedonobacteraceae bacterium]
MRKLVASMLMALDGVVENPQMWTVQFRSEESQHYKFDELFASDALLLGRRTYQDFAAGWPGVTGAYGERINRMPKYVPTTTLQEAEWNATLIKDHVGEGVTRLKQEPGQDIWFSFAAGDSNPNSTPIPANFSLWGTVLGAWTSIVPSEI